MIKVELFQERKRDFHLGGTQKEGESKVLPPSKRHKESMCKSKERGSCTRKKRETNKEPLKEKEDSQERAVRGEENKKERAKCCRL